MSNDIQSPMVVIVRDGWGTNPNPEQNEFNAIHIANTPNCDTLVKNYPTTLIHTSGEDVGLPDDTMGNSEVGHQNIGAGRIVYQESVRISKAIREGELINNKSLVDAINTAKQNNKAVHLVGLASDAGVHALMTHLYGCLELCKQRDMTNVYVHCFTDGRDTGPYTGKEFVNQVQSKCNEIGVGRVVSLCGRYYAMDRDNRWERVKLAYDLLTGRDQFPHFDTPEQAITDYYDNPTSDSQNGDEFLTPRTIGPNPDQSRIKADDTFIFYNYRGDRPREITRAFCMPEFYGHVPPSPDTNEKGFDRGPRLNLNYVCMTAYETEFTSFPGLTVAFPKPPKMENIGAQWIADQNLTQFRCAETEKFPHVTFFFNDYRDDPFPGEERAIIPSPQVSTYDLQPEMSAYGIRDAVLDALDKDFAILIVNFANGDMVGHTGKLDAAVKAIETVDECVGAIVEKTLEKGGQLIVTADHGNAEQMFDPNTNAPHTAHTTYDVECIIVDKRYPKDTKLKSDGRLADVIPTAFALMGLKQPQEMTGQSLLP